MIEELVDASFDVVDILEAWHGNLVGQFVIMSSPIAHQMGLIMGMPITHRKANLFAGSLANNVCSG